MLVPNREQIPVVQFKQNTSVLTVATQEEHNFAPKKSCRYKIKPMGDTHSKKRDF